MCTASNLLEAVQKTVKQLTGAYGMVVLDREHPEHLVAARFRQPIGDWFRDW